MSDEVRFKLTPHVWFDRTARILHCDRCPHQEALETDYAEDRITAFAKAHSTCPVEPTAESRQAALDREYSAGFLAAFGVR